MVILLELLVWIGKSLNDSVDMIETIIHLASRSVNSEICQPPFQRV